MKGEKYEEDLNAVLHYFHRKVNAKNRAATDEFFQVKVHGQCVSVANFVHKNWYIFWSKK
jgi:hypothetical protein